MRRDAAAIATALNRTVTDRLLNRAFPGRPHLAQFDFETEPPPSAVDVFDLASKAVQAGYRVEKAELEERTGYRLSVATPSEAAPEMDDFSPGLAFNKASSPQPMQRAQRELRALARSLQLDLTPVAEALETFLQAPCESEARALIARLPELLPEDPQSAAILEQALAEAFATEVSKKDATVANSRTYVRGGDPKFPGRFSKAPGSGQREPETKAVKDSLGKKFDPEHPERYTVDDNLARGKKALRRALTKKQSVRDAMYRKECGFIDFIWGKPGTKDKAIDRSDGFGISHVFAKHPNDIDALPEIIAKGTAYKVKSKGDDGTMGYHGRLAFVYEKRAIFVDPQPKGKSLVVSEYRKELKAIEAIKKNPKA